MEDDHVLTKQEKRDLAAYMSGEYDARTVRGQLRCDSEEVAPLEGKP